MTTDESATDMLEHSVSFEQLLHAYNQALAAPAADGEPSLLPLYIPNLKTAGARQYQVDRYVLDERGRGLLLMVQAYPGMALNDTLEVLDGHGQVLASAQISAGREDGHFSLFIPADLLQPGPLELVLAVTVAESGLRRTSVPVNVVVVPPPVIFGSGPPLLPAPLVDQADNGQLSPLLQQVALQIPGDGLFYGSYVTLNWLWRASTGRLIPGQASWDVSRNMAGRALTRQVVQALEPFSGGTLEVHYLVEHDDWAQPQASAITLLTIGEEPLAVPQVPDASNAALGIGALFSGFTVRVPTYPGMRWGDEVELHCVTVPAVSEPLLLNRPITQALVGTALDYRVDADYVRQHAGKQLLLSYTVWHYDGRAPTSDTVAVTVASLGPDRLPSVELGPLAAAGVNLGSFSGDLQLHVSPSEYLLPGLKYWIEATGTDVRGKPLTWLMADGLVVTSAQASQGVAVQAQRTALERLESDSLLNVRLQVAPEGQSRAQAIDCSALHLTISTFVFGPDHALHTNAYIIAKGRPPKVPNPESNAFYQRVPTGGRAPFSYRSSNTDVAWVDAKTGGVRAVGNGIANIIATDARGQTASYRLIISGVQCVQRKDGVFWSANVTSAERLWEFKALSVAQMRQFWDTYYPSEGCVTTALGWPASNYWTGDNVLANSNAWAFLLNAEYAEGVETAGWLKLPVLVRVAG
ncbi:MAG: hypothetical protein ACN6P2_07555 [Pseudomonas palmensis]|uniref:hypothetical protein n=1 Tax=Pseudomonas palmensis TaxID=2815362 RepID=UPI003D0B60F6